MSTLSSILANEKKWQERMEAAQPCPHCGATLTMMQDHHGRYLEHTDEPCIHAGTQIFDNADLTLWNQRK